MKTTMDGFLSAVLFGVLMFCILVLGLCFEEAFVSLRNIVFGE